MVWLLLLIGATLCRGEVVPQNLERLEAALETAAKEGTQGLKRVVRQDDPFYSMPKTHNLFSHLAHQAPAAQGQAQTYQQPAAPAMTWPLKQPTSQVPCSPQTGTPLADGHFHTPHVPSSYSASIPYISGYKLTPVIGQKQIVVNDVAHLPGPAPCPDPAPVYPVMVPYWHQSRAAEDILKPFEQSGYFVAPPDTSHQLRTAKEYQDKIEDLNSNVEHLESMRDNALASGSNISH